MLMNADWFKGFNKDLHNPRLWRSFYASQQQNLNLPNDLPAMPNIDGEWLFWDMMRAARDPDPWMFPALKKLKESGRYILAALSNTMIYPPGHPYNIIAKDSVHSMFDVFISSAHVGTRKPDPRMYELAVTEVDKFARQNASRRGKNLGWQEGVKPQDIVFLDDIGENLKGAKQAGFATIKVRLGRAYEAVDALEEMTGLELAGSHPRVAVPPKARL